MPWNSGDAFFEKWIPQILNWEGGAKVVNHPKDPGGKTKYGISTNACSGAMQKLGVKDVADLTEDQARKIYYENYWRASKAEEIPDDGLALIHFDAAINHGVGRAGKFLLQLSKNPKHFTGNGLNKTLFYRLCIEYLMLRLEAYNKDPNRKSFLEGWVNRIIKLAREILK